MFPLYSSTGSLCQSNLKQDDMITVRMHWESETVNTMVKQWWMFWGRFAYNLGKFNLLHHLCSSCNEQWDTTNSTWIEHLILQWNILYPTCMSLGQCGYKNYVMCKAMWNCGKQRQWWCQWKQNIHSGLVWMHVYLLQSTCWSGLEWNLVQLHCNPFEHMLIEMNTCASKQVL